MSTNQPSRLPALRRVLGSWYPPAALGLFLLLALGVWVAPRRIERVVADPTTGEARIVAFWDTSRWQAVSAHGWQTLLLALVATALLAGAWYTRDRVLRAAAAARFFALSLAVHLLLGVWLCAVPLARAVVEHAEVIRVNQAAQLFDEEPQPGRAAERPAYEKVADLRPDTEAMPDLVRHAPAPIHVPDLTDSLVPTIPSHLVRSLPPERILFVPPRQPEVVRHPPAIERRAYAINPAEVEFAPLARPVTEEAPKEKPLEGRLVSQEREKPAGPIPDLPEPLRLPELKLPRPADLRPEADRAPPVKETEKVPGALVRQPVGRGTPAAPREQEAELKAELAPAVSPPSDARPTLPRLVGPAPLPAGMPDDPAGKALPQMRPNRVAIPSPLPATLPRIDPLALPLPRTPARADHVARVEEKAVPPAALVLRDKEVRQTSVEMYGGTKASEEAVERGLDWLAAHQNANGSWSLHNFHANCRHPKCPDAGTVNSDPAGTGIVLLPFLGAGHTHRAGKHQKTVARAVQWLVDHQQPSGTWPAPADSRPMYGHGIASIALCEAYGMTQDPKLRAPAQRALDYIVKAQHPGTGGWRYTPKTPADTSVVGWQLMALKSGEMAGLKVPPQTFEGVKRWLASVEGNKPTGGKFGYQSPLPVTPPMTAQGLLCLQYLGARRDDPRMQAGTAFLLERLPQAGAETSYYWYHATQVMFHMQGKHWKAWNGRLRDLLVNSQVKEGTLAGSWAPVDYREKPGGRLYATALRLLMLEVYYRHLPLYQQLEK